MIWKNIYTHKVYVKTYIILIPSIFNTALIKDRRKIYREGDWELCVNYI
jgi:hypothetical protein